MSLWWKVKTRGFRKNSSWVKQYEGSEADAHIEYERLKSGRHNGLIILVDGEDGIVARGRIVRSVAAPLEEAPTLDKAIETARAKVVEAEEDLRDACAAQFDAEGQLSRWRAIDAALTGAQDVARGTKMATLQGKIRAFPTEREQEEESDDRQGVQSVPGEPERDARPDGS